MAAKKRKAKKKPEEVFSPAVEYVVEVKAPKHENEKLDGKVLNWRPSPKDPKAYSFAARTSLTSEAYLPKFVDLEPSQSGIHDQGSSSSCVGQSGAVYVECLERAHGDEPYFQASSRFIWYLARKMRNWQSYDEGCYIWDAAKVMATYGVCPDSYMPWKSGAHAEAPSTAAYTAAAPRKITEYSRILNTDPAQNLYEIRAALAAHFPVWFGFTCFSNLGQAYDDGLVPLPSGSVVGGHAVTAVGYNDRKRTIKFKNSWGTDWGTGGYGFLPYDFILAPNMQLADDFVVIKK